MPQVRAVPLIILIAVIALSSCSVATEVAITTPATPAKANEIALSGLPAVGPIPGQHWHAAYVVRICDEVLAPFDSTDDPLGIHSHDDGLVHIHPFFESSGYENATMGLFADAMGVALEEGMITLPGGGTWRDGDMCDEKPGRVFIDRWSGPTPESEFERIFESPEATRFLADGEMYQIAFAPVDSPPVVPPSSALLDQVSNLDLQIGDPWVDISPSAPQGHVQLWTIASVDSPPCDTSEVPERVLSGASSCFSRAGEVVSAHEAIVGARPVTSNRQPAVELEITPAFRAVIASHFLTTDNPLAFAIQVGDEVVYAPQLARLPLSPNRLVLSGGMTEDSARAFAALLSR